MFKKFKTLLVEMVFLATVVGFIPELTVGAVVDLFGPCGFDADTCTQVEIQGAVKAMFAFICFVVAVVISLILCEETYANESDEGQ